MTRKSVFLSLLVLLGFLLAAGIRHSFGDGRSDLRVSISETQGTPFYKIEPMTQVKVPQTIAQILRQRISWPCHLMLTKPQRVPVYSDGAIAGVVTLPAGRHIIADVLRDDGMLEVYFQGSVILVPIEDTDLIGPATTTSAGKDLCALPRVPTAPAALRHVEEGGHGTDISEAAA